MANPTPVVLTDANGNVLILTGLTAAAPPPTHGEPTPVVITDANGNVYPLGSPTPLPNGTTATTQAAFDNSLNVATTQYVDQAVAYGSVGASFEDDFFHGASNAAITTATGIQGDTNWSTAQIVGGTQSLAASLGTWSHQGQITLTTSATSGDGITLYKGGGTNSAAAFGLLGANAGWQSDWWVQTPATITSYATRIGLPITAQQVADPPTGGAWVVYDTASASMKGGILTHGSITGGSSYTAGTYTNVPITGGTGTGAIATIVVSGGAVTTVTFTTAGTGYLATDTGLSASAANIGGTGSGFSFPLATVTANWNLVTGKASAYLFTDTGVAFTASTWYHIKIYSTVAAGAGTILCAIGTSEGALSTPITVSNATYIDNTHAYMPCIQVLPRTTSARVLVVDKVSYFATATGRG